MSMLILTFSGHFIHSLASLLSLTPIVQATALRNLGVCYFAGEGVEQSYKKAVRYYMMGAEKGEGSALNNLG